VGSLLFGDPQLPDWNPLAFVAVPAQTGDGDSGDACVAQVLLEDAIVKPDGSVGGAWCIWCLDVEIYVNEIRVTWDGSVDPMCLGFEERNERGRGGL